MRKELLFTEKQRFTQWWVWLILLSINFIFLFGVFKQVILGDPFGSKPMSNTALLITTGVTLGLVLLFINLRLKPRYAATAFMSASSLFTVGSDALAGTELPEPSLELIIHWPNMVAGVCV